MEREIIFRLDKYKYTREFHPKSVLEMAKKSIENRLALLEDEVFGFGGGARDDKTLKEYKEEIEELKSLLELYSKIVIYLRVSV